MIASTIKIHQSAFVKDLVIKKRLTNYNANVILMKVGSSIERTESENYEKANFYTYQRLIKKLIYLLCNTRPDISFVVGQFNRHNIDLKKGHL